MSESNVGGVRRGYESPTARIVAVESGCVVRASVWTAAPFGYNPDGNWGDVEGDEMSTANPFDNGLLNGLWCDANDSPSSATPFGTLDPGTWGDLSGSDGVSTAKAFEENTGRW